LIAGLTGAGIAWVLSALAASRLVMARDAGTSEETPREPHRGIEESPGFFVKMRAVRSRQEPERARPKTGRSAPPPLVSPPPFRRPDR
jgi:hypothetical protein